MKEDLIKISEILRTCWRLKKLSVFRVAIDSLSLNKESDNRSRWWKTSNKSGSQIDFQFSGSRNPGIPLDRSWKTFHLAKVSFYKQNTSTKGRKRIQSSIIFHFKRFSVTSIPFRMRTFVCKSRKSARNAADYSGLSQTDFQMISKLSSALKALWREAKQLRSGFSKEAINIKRDYKFFLSINYSWKYRRNMCIKSCKSHKSINHLIYDVIFYSAAPVLGER